ncbi:hypothetical protein D3C87_1637240 [compost metagenome]
MQKTSGLEVQPQVAGLFICKENASVTGCMQHGVVKYIGATHSHLSFTGIQFSTEVLVTECSKIFNGRRVGIPVSPAPINQEANTQLLRQCRNAATYCEAQGQYSNHSLQH